MAKDIIITDRLGVVRTDVDEAYLSHLLCLGGSCNLVFNEKEFRLEAGDLAIIRRRSLIGRISPSDDFRCKIIYARPSFIEQSTPQSNYGMKGQLSLFGNPVIHLTPEQQETCLRDFDILEKRVADTKHRFYQETVVNAMQTAILDFFDFHARLNDGCDEVSTQNATIMNRFLTMLEQRTYREHREVSYYADRLCVSPKYLSEVSKKVSGYPANYWINRYTTIDISRQLRDKSLTITEISELFSFSSTAYFSRYVQRNLGVKPSEYKG